MADENARAGVAGRVARTPVVFVSDAADESVRIADTLRSAGYAVADVPLTTLVARAQVQRPNVVLLDVDASGALEEVLKLRRIPGGGGIDFVYFGSGTGSVRNADDAMTNDGSAFFRRPVDVGALVRRVESLTGGPVLRPDVRPSTPPPSIVGRRGSVPPDGSPSLPAPGLRTPGPPLPMSSPSLADLVDPPARSLAAMGTVSNELQQLLAEAEMRAEVAPHPHVDGPLPTPEEEIEAVLPADVLASLDEPLEADEDEENEIKVLTGPGAEGTGAHAKGTTSGGSRHTTSSGRTPHTHERRVGSENPPRRPSDAPATTTGSRPPTTAATGTSPNIVVKPAPVIEKREERPPTDVGKRAEPARVEAPPAPVAPPAATDKAKEDRARREQVTTRDVVVTASSSQAPERGPSEAPPRSSIASVVLTGPTDARRFIADAVSRRLSGALCFEHEKIVRRLVIRDGDLVTAASGADRESLVCFLGARGELPRDEVDRLAGKVPPYGRHAGAALVAHGWLKQDQLWVVLRAHAEWIATSALRLTGGTAQLETEPPGRLRSEPSVFGACTGAEVFVELVRRAIPTEEAINALGGEGSRIADGASPNLLSECALPAAELELMTRARGSTLGELLSRSPDADIAAVVHSLSLLGILEVVPPAEPSRVDRSVADLEVAALDDEAQRARVRARSELVEEGDYFAVLGVARDATGYEIRRAFVELRRTFEPTRILTPRLVDLADDVRKIVIVLEEAYDILRDPARRERYRRAIDASP